MQNAIVAGGGIAGLAAAIALRMNDVLQTEVTVLERAARFSELGAGIQLGPNAITALHCLGISTDTVRQYAGVPDAISIHSVHNGKRITRMPLAETVIRHYGQPYLTIRRSDLHRLLLDRAKKLGVYCRTGCTVQKTVQNSEGVSIYYRKAASDNTEHTDSTTTEEYSVQAAALVAADGVYGKLRNHLLPDGGRPLRQTGHWAYRATVPVSSTPSRWHRDVTLWWGKNMHIVHYPVACGEWLNIVLLLENAKIMPSDQPVSTRITQKKAAPIKNDDDGGISTWDRTMPAETMLDILRHHTSLDENLTELLSLPSEWGVWELTERKADTHCAVGSSLLTGDAAHPMLPYLAQGAAMALEDAAQLLTCLRTVSTQKKTEPAVYFQQAFAHFAKLRTARNARVQNTARRNAGIFHLSGPAAMMRNAFLALQGERLRMSWLYGWQPQAVRK